MMKEFRLLMVSGHIFLGMVQLDLSISKMSVDEMQSQHNSPVFNQTELSLNHLMTSDSQRKDV